MFYFIIELVFLIRFRQENLFVVAAGWNPVVVMTQPFLLLLGAICLLIDRGSSYVVAILLSGGLIYSNVYLGLVGISHAHGLEQFGITAFRRLLEVMSGTQIVNSGLAVVILIFSLVKLYLCIARPMGDVTTTEG